MVLCDTVIYKFLTACGTAARGWSQRTTWRSPGWWTRGGSSASCPWTVWQLVILGGIFNGNNAFLLSGTTSRGIVGTSGGISIEQENLFDEVGHGLERPNEVNRSFSWKKSENKSFLSEQYAVPRHVHVAYSREARCEDPSISFG